MRAIVVEEPGGLDALQIRELPDPTPGPRGVLIETAYAGCNWADTQVRQGIYPHPIQYPRIPGGEISGHILEVGDQVTGVSVGDRVAAVAPDGGYAEKCVAPQGLVTRLPPEFPLDLAAAFQTHACTAFHMLHTIHDTNPGNVVLAHAVGGGVGLCVTQIAINAGAKVIGTVGTPGKETKPLEYGAARVIITREADFVEEVLELTDGRGADLAIDSLGAGTLDRTFDAVRVFGHIINIGEAEGVPFPNIRERVLPRSQSFTRFSLGHVREQPDLWKTGVDHLVRALMDGTLEIPIVDRFPLEHVKDMHARLEGRGVCGKLLLAVGG